MSLLKVYRAEITTTEKTTEMPKKVLSDNRYELTINAISYGLLKGYEIEQCKPVLTMHFKNGLVKNYRIRYQRNGKLSVEK